MKRLVIKGQSLNNFSRNNNTFYLQYEFYFKLINNKTFKLMYN